MEVETPSWADGKTINEAVFCNEFLNKHKIIFSGNSFFTIEGRVVDEAPLRRMIFDDLKVYAVSNVPQKISNIVELLKLEALDEDFAPETNRIHLEDGALYFNRCFVDIKSEVVRTRLPVRYNPYAPKPERWLSFLDELLYPEDIPTLQEFIGYCLIPSNKGQRMMIIKGNGGEGKSQIGAVMSTLFGNNMKDGSIAKISENRFARADLEHILLCIDDDLRMEGLKQTNYVKSIVTAQGKMDLEKKNKQSYQGYMYARLLAFSNGDLQAMFDKSDGFYRRQLVLTTRDKPESRVDDPFIGDKMSKEIEGIFLWAFEGLLRLIANNFQFTESERAKANREAVKRNNVNAVEFMESEGYFVFAEDKSITSKELYEIYKLWCEENALSPMSSRSLSDFLVANENKYGIRNSNNIYNREHRRVRGFIGMEAKVSPFMNSLNV
ncbi:MAG: phage/plasmid primase, P4 family [Oscillospiraceae bacterium]